MAHERWSPIPDFEGFYSASDLGRIRRDKTTTRTKAGHIMKAVATRDGYLQVGLSIGGSASTKRVHRLVWAAFHGSVPGGLVVNHIDGVKTNNRLDNLEAITVAENVRHGFDVLDRDRGGNAKITPGIAREMREERARGVSLKSIAERHSVTPACVSSVCTGKTWKHAGGPVTPARSQRATPQEVQGRCGPEVVAAVRRRYAAGEGSSVLAREFGVTKRTILNWVQGKTREN